MEDLPPRILCEIRSRVVENENGMLDEATFDELMFTILYMSGYKPSSEFNVRDGDGNTKKKLPTGEYSGPLCHFSSM